jgi:hypothetical protein
MESRKPTRRFPPPWPVEKTEHGYIIRDQNGVSLAHVYCRDDLHASKWGDYLQHLTSDEARRIATAISRLPEFLKVEPQFEARRVKRHGRYWKASAPYHVALLEAYLNENYDEIAACCAFNRVPFAATGEILMVGGVRWRTFEFARQYDGIRFWDKFEGRWVVGNDFHYPERPKGLVPMMSLRRRGAI